MRGNFGAIALILIGALALAINLGLLQVDFARLGRFRAPAEHLVALAADPARYRHVSCPGYRRSWPGAALVAGPAELDRGSGNGGPASLPPLPLPG